MIKCKILISAYDKIVTYFSNYRKRFFTQRKRYAVEATRIIISITQNKKIEIVSHGKTTSWDERFNRKT